MRARAIRTRAIIGIGAAALALAACGGGYGSDESSEAADGPDAGAAPEAAADAAPVGEADTGLGTVLVDAEGLTLYGLTDDTDGIPTCDGACADAWPPLTVDSAELPAGLDADLYRVVERSDGTFQLAAGAWPLYGFAGDAAPGDTNGQGSGGVWFAVAPDGSLIGGPDAAPAASDSAY
ncbi:MAG: COG4315 family predicted lipoprotein [Acidimicrobiales bacterium]